MNSSRAAMLCTYAIGDVHGRADLLKALLSAIHADADQNGWVPRVIYLGDIIDHGPDSKHSMNLVVQTIKDSSDSKLILGNHDKFLLEFMTAERIDPSRFTRWMQQAGGFQTVRSYGLDAFDSLKDMATYFREHYADHLEILSKADRLIIDRKFAFVHAGIDPDLLLAQQSEYDLMWIRHKFLDFDGELPHVFIHGHTPSQDFQPVLKPNRIGIDTWAFRSDRLTCLSIPPDQSNLRFHTSQNSEGKFCVQVRETTVPSAIHE